MLSELVAETASTGWEIPYGKARMTGPSKNDVVKRKSIYEVLTKWHLVLKLVV